MMEKKIAQKLLCFVAVLACGCVGEFEPQSSVGRFRILAVKADPPAGLPGTEVTFTPLMSEPRTGRFPILFWMSCNPYPGQTGKQCIEGGKAELRTSEETFSLVLPALGEEEDSMKIDVVLMACVGVPRVPDFENGDYDFCDGAESDIAIKSVEVVKEDPNANPEIESLEFQIPGTGSVAPVEGEPLLIDCSGGCGEVVVALRLTPGSLESYREERFGEMETKNEDIFISWFATAGSFAHSRSYERSYSAPGERREDLFYEDAWTPPGEGGEATFYFLAYDGRGGVDFRLQEAFVAHGGE